MGSPSVEKVFEDEAFDVRMKGYVNLVLLNLKFIDLTITNLEGVIQILLSRGSSVHITGNVCLRAMFLHWINWHRPRVQWDL